MGGLSKSDIHITLSYNTRLKNPGLQGLFLTMVWCLQSYTDCFYQHTWCDKSRRRKKQERPGKGGCLISSTAEKKVCETTSSSPAAANCLILDWSLTRESSGGSQNSLTEDCPQSCPPPATIPSTSIWLGYNPVLRKTKMAEKKGEADSFAAVSILKQLV